MEVSALQVVLSLLGAGASYLAQLAAIVLCFVGYARIREVWRPLLAFAAFVTLLGVPFQVGLLWIVDFHRIAAEAGVNLPPEQIESVAWFSRVGALIGTLVGIPVGLVFTWASVMGAEAVDDRSAFPWVTGRAGAGKGMWQGLAFGVGVAVVSQVVFTAADVQASEAIEQAMDSVLTTTEPTWTFELFVIGPLVLSAAFFEEVVFRGVLQRGLTRLLGGGPWAAVVGIGVTTVFFVLAHALNTDAIVMKSLQIGVLSVGLGWLAHRWSVEAAIAGHVGLNGSSLLFLLTARLFG